MARKSRKNMETITNEVVSQSTSYKAAGYIRLSVEDNKKRGDSIETQKSILESFIATNPDISIHDFYIDNGTSGTTFTRPAFQKMLADAESGVINCIIVKDLSRFGRNAIDTGYYIERYLPTLNCRFIAITDDFDTNNTTNNGANVILPLKNIINEAYALDIGRKIKAQQRQAMKSGEYVGARPPYGYLKDPTNCHKLIIDPITAPTVKRIYELFLSDISLNEIVLRLNGDKIATPSHYRRETGLISNENLIGNGLWQTFTIKRILTNEVYVGDMVQGKSSCTARHQTPVDESKWIRIPDTHEPIITREDFAKAQSRLNKLTELAATRQKKPYSPNIFKGKVFCGHCGGNMHRQRQTRAKSEDVYVFICLSNTRKARGSCVSYSMPEKILTETLLQTIKSQADTIIGKSIKLRKNADEIDIKRQVVKTELITLRQEADKNGRMFKSLYESLVSGLITNEEYHHMRQDYELKTKGNLEKARKLEKHQAELDKQVSEYCEMSDLIARADNAGITPTLIENLVDKITIFSDRSIDVNFKFTNNFKMIGEVLGNE